MVKRHIFQVPVVLAVSILISAALYFQYDQSAVQPAWDWNVKQHPVASIGRLYRAVEGGKWEEVQRLVSPETWSNLEHQGFNNKWNNLRAGDPSLDYVSFAVMDWRQEGNVAWVTGRAVWVSSQNMVPDETQKVTLKKEGGDWLITNIEFFPAVDAVGEFFARLSVEDRQAVEALSTREVFLSVSPLAGVRSANFIAEDFAVVGEKAWVKGKVVTADEETTQITPVSVQLQNDGQRWYIKKVVTDRPEK